MELTNDQIVGLNRLKVLPKGSIVLLTGSAGTGKTTLVSNYLIGLNGSINVTAPTHKAVQVLQLKNPEFICGTIHSFLSLSPKLVHSKYQLIQNELKVIKTNYLIIDEASMIDSELWKYIIDYYENYRPTILFIGDKKQLNPINEVMSKVFDSDIEEIELTTIVRHDNDIIDLSRNLQWVKEKKSGNNFKWEFPIEKLVEANGSDKCKFITWTNDKVTKINNDVRKLLYHTDKPDQFYIGEVILIIEHYTAGEEVLYRNNEEVVVESISDYELNGFQCYLINKKLPILKESSVKEYNELLKTCQDLCIAKKYNWKDYYQLKEMFGSYQYNHAITVHRAQGSTYDEAIVDCSLLCMNTNIREKNKMLYTALTRARLNNYLV